MITTNFCAKSISGSCSELPALEPINASLSADEKLGLLRTMLKIRRFEERSLRAYQGKKIGGFCHVYSGQEAIATGSCSLLAHSDHIITAYRDHGHAIAVGMDVKYLMAEQYGKATGCSKGKGGSMHFFDPSRNFWGGHGIVGGQVPLGIGIAFALKYNNIKGSCLTFLGDGAVNQGAVHESYNLAALWQLPVVFIIENNGYSMGTSQARSSAGELGKRAEAYNMEWGACDGQNLYTVRLEVHKHMELAREQCRPSVLELKTYRFRGHSVADPDNTYRTKEEVEEYRNNYDPITLFKQQLVKEGVLNDLSADQINDQVTKEIEQAVVFSELSPFPTKDQITQDVYWEEDHPESKTSTGRIFF